MDTNYQVKLLQKQRYLKTNLIANISKCLEEAVRKKNIGGLKSKLTTAVVRSIKNFESSTKAFESLQKDNTCLVNDNVITSQLHSSNPEIEALERSRNSLRMQLRTKESEFINLTRRTNVTKELTGNDAIASLVGNIIKKFKTLSEEKQLHLTNDKALLARNVEKYIKETIVFYDTEERQWGITFEKKDAIFENIATGKDVVILAMNLSSKYVHLATSSIYNATRIQHLVQKRKGRT